MTKSGLSLAIAILLLTSLPSSLADDGENQTMQANSGEQPSHENNTFYLWGRDNGNPCWGHFNNSDSGSSADGYGEESRSSGQLEIEWTCRMDPPLADDFALDGDGEIVVHLMIDVQGNWENGNGCNGNCEELNVSLMKGGVEAARFQFSSMTTGENEIVVTFPVNETLQVWDKNTDNPGIRVRMVLEATTGFGCGFIFNCDASFRMYYSGQDSENYNGTATFPILNETAAEEILDDDEGKKDSEKTPGFTLVAVAVAVGVAASARRHKMSR